jgi:peptide/nickel transport system substrate-binding protein
MDLAAMSREEISRSPHTPMRTPLAALALAPLLAACPDASRESMDSGSTGGTVVIVSSAPGQTFLPQLIDDVLEKQVVDQVFDRLAEIGQELNTVGDAGFTPRLAERWEWAGDSLSIAFHLDPDARWHDGRPVRASDVRFTFDLYRDPAVGSPHASVVETLDSVSVQDSLTAVIWFRRRYPEQFFDATYQMMITPEHLLKDVPRGELATSTFGQSPVGSGRFRFVRGVPRQSIEIVADTANYRGRARLDRVIWSLVADPAAATNALFTGNADFFEALRPDLITELQKHADLRVVRYPTLQYGFIGFNLRDPANRSRPHPLFGDRAFRRAIAMGINREQVVRTAYDTMAIIAIGPVARKLAVADTTLAQIPYDTVRAAALLDSLGWRDTNGDGVRDRNGRPLTFGFIVPASSSFRVRMALVVQDQLRRLGIDVKVDQLDFGLWGSRSQQGQFDATFGFFAMDPSPNSIRQTFTSAGTSGGLNYGWYRNPAFDALVDSGLTAMNPDRQRGYFRRAYQTIIDDAPAVFLYEGAGVAGGHERIQFPPFRADGWWVTLADWSIAPGGRIARDNVGLRTSGN